MKPIRSGATRIASARSRLDWARKTTFVPADEKKALVLNAAKDLVTAQQDLANFFYTRRKDYDQALRIAQEGLQIIDTEAELADAEEQRFALRKIVVNALVQLKRNEEALREAQTATAGMLGSSRKSLQDAWARAIKTHDDVAEYLSAIGIRSRAVAVAQQVVDVLEQEARSPFETAGPSVLAGAYTRLSWHQLLVRKFADAQGTVEKGLALAVSDVQKALLSAKLAHALLFQDGGERAREIYETWKAKPVETKEKDPTLFARVVLDDFGQLERIGTHSSDDASHPQVDGGGPGQAEGRAGATEARQLSSSRAVASRSGASRVDGLRRAGPLQEVGKPHREIDTFADLARARGVARRAAQLVELAQEQLQAVGDELVPKGRVLPRPRQVGVCDKGHPAHRRISSLHGFSSRSLAEAGL